MMMGCSYCCCVAIVPQTLCFACALLVEFLVWFGLVLFSKYLLVLILFELFVLFFFECHLLLRFFFNTKTVTFLSCCPVCSSRRFVCVRFLSFVFFSRSIGGGGWWSVVMQRSSRGQSPPSSRSSTAGRCVRPRFACVSMMCVCVSMICLCIHVWCVCITCVHDLCVCQCFVCVHDCVCP